MPNQYLIDARDKPALLAATMKTLAGDARISFEGNLSRVDFGSIAGTSNEETHILKRNTIEPLQDFVVLPLEPESVASILRALSFGGALSDDILHVQIEKAGRLEFGAYDNFHPDCVVACEGVLVPVLRHLLEQQISRSFHQVPEQQSTV